jgi:hypothetical protein
MESYFKQCIGDGDYTPVKLNQSEATHPENIKAALSEVGGTHLADIIVGLVHRCAVLDSSVAESNDSLTEARTELQYVLNDWNTLVAASGSRTNGGAVGYVAKMRSDMVDLKRENENLTRQLSLLQECSEPHLC